MLCLIKSLGIVGMKMRLNSKGMHYAFLFASISLSNFAIASDLTPLTDVELASETGQALFNLSYIAPSDTKNQMGAASGVGFYKLGIEAELDLNANVKNLQLGCGGVNGAGACDIDIKNLAISGLPDSYDANGNPVFAAGRPSTSAKLTNPFIEFAIKNPNSASTREVSGFRLSAEKIVGLLTAGTANTTLPSDGIQRLSGFMQIASTTGSTTTQSTTFGRTPDQTITGRIKGSVLGIPFERQIKSYPAAGQTGGDSNTTGITVPSMAVDFTIPNFTVNGVRQQNAVVNGVKSTIANIPLSTPTGSADYGVYANDQLYVNLRDKSNVNSQSCVALVVCNAKFKMDKGSAIQNLNLDITFTQALSMIHNIPLNGTGAYLALQTQDLRWPGANAADVAKRGWWMSFADPVNLGVLNVTQQVDISSVLPQVAQAVSSELDDPGIQLPGSASFQALFSQPIYKQLVIDVNSYTTANPATISLQNLILQNQVPTTNCYGGLTFC
jgi:hypothetical protein